ncbi:kanosamine 6-kinase [Frankia sp. EI5c]|uniref:ROK family protein n=1 Tax=Frankia sp. EI5c TaxID=683316 RepID=UPI0007C3331D|nr:ROK family protein [Frankia sp. EI5c]OAA25878.1 kanosamine 6-kinase [Frankia sp. EI5c]
MSHSRTTEPAGRSRTACAATGAAASGRDGILGIDVGGTKVALRLVAAGGPPRAAVMHWTPGVPAETDLRDLGRHVTELCAAWDGRVSAVGVAMPATLAADGRVTTWPSRPSWAGLDLGRALRDLVPGARVALGDDGDLAALAEADHAGATNLVYLGVGTGIGGGIVLDGRLCPGPMRGSCELGHLIIAMEGPRCRCGRRGCLQALASGPATLRRATDLRDATGQCDPAAPVPGVAPGLAPRPTVTYPELRRAWETGESWAHAALQATALALAAAVVSLTELVRPDLAVIGGGFADGLTGFTELVAARAEDLARPGHPPAPVRAAALGGLSSLAGAVLLARDLDRTPG